MTKSPTITLLTVDEQQDNINIDRTYSSVPELCVECWLPRDADRCGACWGGLGPLRGDPGGSVSVMDIRLAIGLTTGGVVGLLPPPTANWTWAATAALN